MKTVSLGVIIIFGGSILFTICSARYDASSLRIPAPLMTANVLLRTVTYLCFSRRGVLRIDSMALAVSHAILRDCPTVRDEDELGFLSDEAAKIADTV